MTGRGLLTLAALCALLVWPVGTARGEGAALDRKVVLVLNSYHWGYSWTDAQVAGIMEVLNAAPERPEIFLEHMDALRRPAGPDDHFMEDYLRRRFGALRFDLVIVTDDPALEFAVRHHAELFPAASIVFSDARNFDADAVRPDIPVTGIREHLDIAGTLEAARLLLPEARRVVVFGNRAATGSGFARAHDTLLKIPSPIPVEQHTDLLLEDILAKLAGLSAGDIVIPLASAVDAGGRHHDFSSVIQRMAKVSAAPLFDIESQRVKSGITIGGSVEDGVAQGRVAAGMGLRILAGTRARDIPVASPERLLMFSYPVLQRYGIPESRLPAGSVLVGKPPGLYAQYRGIVWATGLALLALVVVIGILIVNIRRRRQAEAVLEQSEEHLRLALDGTTDAAWDWNMQSGAVYVSPRSFTMLGYEPGGFPLDYASWREMVHPDDLAEAERRLQAGSSPDKSPFLAEFRMRAKDGSWRWIRSRGAVVERDAEGKVIRSAGSHTDITDAKRAEQRIEAALNEKEILIKEIYHRVKNNLQVVASLLSMQGRSVEDQGVRALFDESAGRVLAMSQVHEQLYQSRDLASIEFKVYLGQLVARLAAQFARQGIHIDAALDDVVLGIETAIPCALIVNELVSNSVKHAFPDGRAGRVRVGLQVGADDRVVLLVSDDGVGLPPGFVPAQSRSLGWRLVLGLTNQIGGSLEISARGAAEGGGTQVAIGFRPAAPESQRYVGALSGGEQAQAG